MLEMERRTESMIIPLHHRGKKICIEFTTTHLHSDVITATIKGMLKLAQVRLLAKFHGKNYLNSRLSPELITPKRTPEVTDAFRRKCRKMHMKRNEECSGIVALRNSVETHGTTRVKFPLPHVIGKKRCDWRTWSQGGRGAKVKLPPRMGRTRHTKASSTSQRFTRTKYVLPSI
ncbi:uncharacterized protein [Fopius arisanus]|uniref:Uncharacterized protein n=1 Tax=Fopius arisanus TaxID=64838 RepID=A0A9R1T0I5_9HYME|nr:PREDICTED: uncharacterized protein LOC105265091 [Fopius arisanus]